MQSFVHDIRWAARSLRRQPGFAAVVTLTLALGIGANTAIFSLTDAVLLRSLPVRDPGSLMALEGKRKDGDVSLSYPLLQEMRERQTVFTDLIADAGASLSRVRMDGRRLSGVRTSSVSGSYFTMLGVQPFLGATFGEEDDLRGGKGGAAVVSYAFWSSRLGGEPSALGRVIQADGHPFTIIGVAPPEFFGTSVGSRTDVWLPMNRSMSEDNLEWRTGTFFKAVGRLNPGITPRQAEQSLSALFRQLLEAEAEHGSTIIRKGAAISNHRIQLHSARNGFDSLRQAYSRPLQVLTAATALVLLIVCFNVANLMLSRAAWRERELATRLALGAGRLRLARQMAMESLLLGLVGGAGGLIIAWAASPLIVAFIASPENAPLLQLKPDLRILGYALSASLATGFVFGLAPVAWSMRRDPSAALGTGRGDSGPGRPRLRLSKALIAVQLAFSLLLLSGAGLLMGTLHNLDTVAVGIEREGLAVARVDIRVPEGGRGEHVRRIEESLEAVPGVRTASISWLGLFSLSDMSTTLDIDGYQPAPNENLSVRLNCVSPSYLESMGIPLISGRPFEHRDGEDAPKVAHVNRSFVQRYFQGRSPLGATFRLRGDDEDVRIVGVTEDFLWNDLRLEAEPIFLVPSSQWGFGLRSIQARLTVPFRSVAQPLRKAIENLDESALLVRLQPMSQQMAGTIRQERLLAYLSGWFSGLGTLLTCLGLCGILSFSVARRRREIGVRMAIGAARSRILGQVLREAGMLLIIGLPLGLLGSWAASRAVSGFLFGMAADDAGIRFGAAALLTVAVITAALLPARRAASVDPVEVLRCE